MTTMMLSCVIKRRLERCAQWCIVFHPTCTTRGSYNERGKIFWGVSDISQKFRFNALGIYDETSLIL